MGLFHYYYTFNDFQIFRFCLRINKGTMKIKGINFNENQLLIQITEHSPANRKISSKAVNCPINGNL